MDKYIGFDIDDKKTVACVRSDGGKERFKTLKTDVQHMKEFLVEEGAGGHRVYLTFEISGQASYWYDQLGPYVQEITVSNPHHLTWIYRRSKDYCAYFGLTPKLDESGSVRRLGHISKQGPSVVRWLIVGGGVACDA